MSGSMEQSERELRDKASQLADEISRFEARLSKQCSSSTPPDSLSELNASLRAFTQPYYSSPLHLANTHNDPSGSSNSFPTSSGASKDFQASLQSLQHRVSDLETRFSSLEGDLLNFKQETRASLNALMGKSNDSHRTLSSFAHAHSAGLLSNGSFATGLSPLPLSATSSSGFPQLSAPSSGMAMPSAVVSLESIKPASPSYGLHDSSSEPEAKRRKRKSDQENKLREIIRVEMGSAIDWDVDIRSGKALRKVPQPDKMPTPGLWVPDFTQTIRQSPHNASFIDAIMARLQSSDMVSANPGLRQLLSQTPNVRSIVETRFSTIKGDYVQSVPSQLEYVLPAHLDCC